MGTNCAGARWVMRGVGAKCAGGVGTKCTGGVGTTMGGVGTKCAGAR
jgi:hypothetical protein